MCIQFSSIHVNVVLKIKDDFSCLKDSLCLDSSLVFRICPYPCFYHTRHFIVFYCVVFYCVRFTLQMFVHQTPKLWRVPINIAFLWSCGKLVDLFFLKGDSRVWDFLNPKNWILHFPWCNSTPTDADEMVRIASCMTHTVRRCRFWLHPMQTVQKASFALFFDWFQSCRKQTDERVREAGWAAWACGVWHVWLAWRCRAACFSSMSVRDS